MIQVRHKKRIGTEDLSFCYPNLLSCQDQMLAVMELSQHLVSSCKTVRPIIHRGARCMGYVKIMLSAVFCSLAPHLHFAEEARPHLCMHKPKRPTPISRRLNLTQAVLVKLIPIDLLTLGMQTPSADILLEYSVSHIKFVHWTARMPNSDKLCNSFRAAGANGRPDFSLSLLAALVDAIIILWPTIFLFPV